MTVEFKTGDLLKEPAQALVNTVNCVGVMGKGIALQFKQAYPQNLNSMKLLTGFTPKALLTNRKSYRPLSAKQRLLELVDTLEIHGVLTDYNARLIEAIALSPLWDKENHRDFIELGLKIARRQFSDMAMNDTNEESLASPENPNNWKK